MTLQFLSLSFGQALSQYKSISVAVNYSVHTKPPASTAPFGLETGMNELGFWGGVSFDSPAGNFLGLTKDREFFIMGLRYGRIITAGWGVALEYVLDIIPIAVVTNNPKAEDERVTISNGHTVIVQRINGWGPVYGAGLSPIGLQIYLLRSNPIKLFASGSFGFLTFIRQVPRPEARKFNYTFDFGGGFQIITRSRWAIVIGYKYHHLSNANTAIANPGLDANVFYVGVSSFR
ncbi:MAG: acyloxyacyl hydrolase [bacterium]